MQKFFVLFLMLCIFPAHIFSQGTENRVLIDVGPPNNGGAITPSPTNGNYWNNMTDAREGVRVSDAKTTTNSSTTIGLSVINRIDGTSNIASNGMNGSNTTPAVGIYPASATLDFAYSHTSATNGRWKIFGLNAATLYIIKFWGAKSGETSNRDIEIKQSDEIVWQSYSAAGNINFNNAAFFNVIGKTEVDFDIRTKSPSTYGYINVVDISWNTNNTNQPPVANAGTNININLPVDSAVLNGCTSTDPENAPLVYKWRKVTGPLSFVIVNDTICSTKIKNLVEGVYSFELMVTDTGGLIHKDTVVVTVAATITSAWPVLPPPICPQPYRIVILGSSTAVGTGASPLDSSWANKLRMFVQQQNAQVIVTNLALGGYTTYHVNPTGYIPGANRPNPDPLRNITAALALNPDAIILNLPTNDAASAFTLQETQNNFNLIDATAAAQHVPVWVTTSQPRTGLSAGAQSNLVQLKDWVNQRFGNKAIDFWTLIANPDGTVNPTYSAGDGVHINNLGHHLVFTRVLNEKIWDSICIRRNIINLPPVANAGTNIVIHTPVDSAFLNGSLSNDPDGSIIIYKWRKVAGPTATIINENNVNTWVKSLVAGNYLFELTVTDNLLAVAKDTVAVLLNITPTANAGNDSSITLPNNNILLSVIASDADGSITSYSWRQYSGALVGNIANANTSQASITFTSQGSYGFEITVADNNGAIAKDSVLIIVYPDPTITWSGALSTAWENPANWVGNVVPSSANNVIIPAGLSRYPVISENTTVRSINCDSGTSVTVATGVLLTVEPLIQ